MVSLTVVVVRLCFRLFCFPVKMEIQELIVAKWLMDVGMLGRKVQLDLRATVVMQMLLSEFIKNFTLFKNQFQKTNLTVESMASLETDITYPYIFTSYFVASCFVGALIGI